MDTTTTGTVTPTVTVTGTMADSNHSTGSDSRPLQPETRSSWNETTERALLSIVVIHVNETIAYEYASRKTSQASGFVVDKELGIILTNRHVVTCGPVTADATFKNKEEVDLTPLYRDPIHDFGFFRFDPSKVRQQEFGEIELHPEGAQIGTEVRVIGNDAGERHVVLPGVLAVTDRKPVSYDFNTFYFTSANNTSGGSSGSPVLSIDGRAIAINSGGLGKEATSFFLPIEGAKRALEIIRRCLRAGKPVEVPRGDLHVCFDYASFAEAQRLGVPDEVVSELLSPSESAKQKQHRGMLVVDKVIKFLDDSHHDPSESTISKTPLAVGDVLLSIDGTTRCSDYYVLERVLNDRVGGEVTLLVQRGSTQVELRCPVHSLDDLIPKQIYTAYGSTFHSITYYDAAARNTPLNEGVYISEASTMLIRDGIGAGYVITDVDGKPVRSLTAFVECFEQLAQDSVVIVQVIADRETRIKEAVEFQVDKSWFLPSKLYTRNDLTGLWDASNGNLNLTLKDGSDAQEATETEAEDPIAMSSVPLAAPISVAQATAKAPIQNPPSSSSRNTNDSYWHSLTDLALHTYFSTYTSLSGYSFFEMLNCMCAVSFTCIPTTFNSVNFDQHLNGLGVVVKINADGGQGHRRRGIIVVSRSIAPNAYGSVSIEFWNAGKVPGKVVFIHPTDFYSLIEFDPNHEELNKSDITVRAARLRKTPISMSSKLVVAGIKGADLFHSAFQITSLAPLLGNPSSQFHASGIDVIYHKDISFDGVVFQGGEVVALATNVSLARDTDKEEPSTTFAGVCIHSLVELLGRSGLGSGPAKQPFVAHGSSWSWPSHGYKFPCYFGQCLLTTAVTMGLTKDWAEKFRKLHKKRRDLKHTIPLMLKVVSVLPRTEAAAVVKPLDVLLAINGELVVTQSDIHAAVRRATAHHDQVRGGAVEVTVLRDKLITVLPLFHLHAVSTMPDHHHVQWAGLMLEPMGDVVLGYLGFDPSKYIPKGKPGIWIDGFRRGSPALRYNFSRNRLLFQVNETPVHSLDDFLEVVRSLPPRTSVRLHQLGRNETVVVSTLLTDPLYWPTLVMKLDTDLSCIVKEWSF